MYEDIYGSEQWTELPDFLKRFFKGGDYELLQATYDDGDLFRHWAQTIQTGSSVVKDGRGNPAFVVTEACLIYTLRYFGEPLLQVMENKLRELNRQNKLFGGIIEPDRFRTSPYLQFWLWTEQRVISAIRYDISAVLNTDAEGVDLCGLEIEPAAFDGVISEVFMPEECEQIHEYRHITFSKRGRLESLETILDKIRLFYNRFGIKLIVYNQMRLLLDGAAELLLGRSLSGGTQEVMAAVGKIRKMSDKAFISRAKLSRDLLSKPVMGTARQLHCEGKSYADSLRRSLEVNIQEAVALDAHYAKKLGADGRLLTKENRVDAGSEAFRLLYNSFKNKKDF